MRRGGKGKENRGVNPSLGGRKREEGIGMERRKKRGGVEQKERKKIVRIKKQREVEVRGREIDQTGRDEERHHQTRRFVG